jgi:hypothetical protein
MPIALQPIQLREINMETGNRHQLMKHIDNLFIMYAEERITLKELHSMITFSVDEILDEILRILNTVKLD